MHASIHIHVHMKHIRTHVFTYTQVMIHVGAHIQINTRAIHIDVSIHTGDTHKTLPI